MLELFKYASPNGPTYPSDGKPIEGFTRAMWVERYDDVGEFSIESPLSSDLKSFLPAGTLISHGKARDIMVVENHETVQDNAEDSQLVITGRSFTSYLENRATAMFMARNNTYVQEFTQSADYTWNQIVQLLLYAISGSTANDNVPHLYAFSSVSPYSGTHLERTIERGDTLGAVLDILKIDNLGLRTVKHPNDATRFAYEVYKGANRSNKVIFSWTGEDLKSISQLISKKKLKNSAMVVGRYVWRAVDLGPVGYDRRQMYVDANDIDGHLEVKPTGTSLTTIQGKMDRRGITKLKKQLEVNVSSAEVSPITEWEYRIDYFLGDKVMIEGDFGQHEIKRISEYAETLDENGYSGQPTFRSLADEDEG